MDRITGPHKGHYIAARSFQIDHAWMGEVRIFTFRPTTFDDPSSIVKLGGDFINAPSELDAIQNAERRGRDWIDRKA